MALFSTNMVKFRPDLEYMTVPELTALKKFRAGTSPSISVFRVKECDLDGCSVEVIKPKLTCCKAHHEKLALQNLEKLKCKVRELAKKSKK